jgi:phage gpG-like protein
MLVAKIKLGLVDHVLTALGRTDLRPAWKEARKPLRADVKEHRNAQAGPDGAWPARSSSTRTRARSGRRARPRKLLGRLPTALTTISDRRRVALRSRVAWSDVHQKGGTAGHGARIPARPFLWASEKVLKIIADIVSRHIASRAR